MSPGRPLRPGIADPMLGLDVGIQSDNNGLAVDHATRWLVSVGRGDDESLSSGARRGLLIHGNPNDEFLTFDYSFHA